jgi:uncharacterized membrane protein
MKKNKRKRPNTTAPAASQQPEQQNSQVTVHHRATQWAGPLPPPDALDAFNSVVENGAERIFTMAEAEQRHRIEYERIGQMAAIADTKRGHYLGAAISIAAVVGAGWTSYEGAPWQVSVAFLSVPVFAVIRAMIGSRSNK